jgi:hypothetical protein
LLRHRRHDHHRSKKQTPDIQGFHCLTLLSVN